MDGGRDRPRRGAPSGKDQTESALAVRKSKSIEPHEETKQEQIKREGADAIALDSGPVDNERWHGDP
jgi:hypothetical protein